MISVIFYLASIIAANILVSVYGIVTVLGLTFPAGAVAVGLTFSARDLVQQKYGKYKCWIFMVVALLITMAFNAKLALASGVAFAASEAIDWAIFTYTKRSLGERIVLSNLIGTPVDSVLFVYLAFGPVWPAMWGQTIVKFVSSLLVVPFLKSRPAVAAVAVAVLAISAPAYAQNAQLHYDFDRKIETLTIEQFVPGKVSAFYFIDIDYNYGIQSIYGEAYASTSIGGAFHADLGLNGGLHRDFPLGQWLLAGVGYGPVTAYARIDKDGKIEPQITGVWNHYFGKFNVSGFVDLWHEGGKWVVLSEPQVWFGMTPHIAIGSEIEISSNFAGEVGWKVRPTAAVKITF